MNAPTPPTEGQILTGALFNEPMRVETVAQMGSGSWTLGLVGTRSERLSVSRVDPLPHQLEAVYDHLLRLARVRFLLADDAGAGKTIMAGLLIRELQLRGLAERILIVAPSNLAFQRQRELQEKFHEKFVVLKGSELRAQFGVNQWMQQPKVVTSLDLAKREEILPGLRQVHDDPRARAVGFLMALYQRRLASSTRAMRRSLANRADRLERGLAQAEDFARTAPPDLPSMDELDEYGGARPGTARAVQLRHPLESQPPPRRASRRGRARRGSRRALSDGALAADRRRDREGCRRRGRESAGRRGTARNGRVPARGAAGPSRTAASGTPTTTGTLATGSRADDQRAGAASG